MSGELPPIRCVTCGKVLADKWLRYKELIENGVTIEEALNQLGLKRPCCRIRMRSPFKTVQRGGTEFDYLSTSIDSQAATTGALEATKSSSFTIVPDEKEEEKEILLPELPDIPDLPDIGEKKITRTYKAW